MNADHIYLDLLERVLREGTKKGDRTGTGTISLFGPQVEYDLSTSFPLFESKKLPFRIIAEELLWFIKGDTDLKTLLDKNINIWTDDGFRFYKENGGDIEDKDEFVAWVKESRFDMGPVYGKQWRSWEVIEWQEDGLYSNTTDQLANLIHQLRTNPDSRRLIVSAWNPAEVDKMALPPCHTMFQFYVEEGNRLSCQMYQRSADLFLGVPFNVASYALLVYILADMVGLKPGRFIHTMGDAHIYLNHIDAVKEQLSRRYDGLTSPKLTILKSHDNIEDYTLADFVLYGYNPQPAIKAPLSTGL
jgi:thymidylate synthase